MRIGDLAGRAGVTARTVRYYEGLGLIPGSERTGGGQRTYDEKDLVYLRRILQLKNFGFSLAQIGLIIRLGRSDISGESQRLELSRQYQGLINENKDKIANLQDLNEELGWHLKQIESAGSGFKDCPGASCAACHYTGRCDMYIQGEKRE
jgi:DNA-binding transcriptional MerR regulator